MDINNEIPSGISLDKISKLTVRFTGANTFRLFITASKNDKANSSCKKFNFYD